MLMFLVFFFVVHRPLAVEEGGLHELAHWKRDPDPRADLQQHQSGPELFGVHVEEALVSWRWFFFLVPCF